MLAHESYDALVVGARCAGAATAMLMARKGLRVLVIDRAGYGTDTISTHALMRGGVLQLHRWGVLPRLQEMGTPAMRETTFHYGDEAVDRRNPAIEGVDALYAPRRTLARQHACGCRAGGRRDGAAWPHPGRPDPSVPTDASAARRCWMPKATPWRSSADLVVGADGIGSSVARLAGAETVREARNATAVIFGYFPGIDLTGYHWWYRPGVGAGAIPTNRGRHCMFAAMPPGRLRHGPWRDDRKAAFDAILREADPTLAAWLPAPSRIEPLRVFAGRKGTCARRRARLGAGRRCGLLQGSADRAWHHRCVARCGTAGQRGRRRDRGGFGGLRRDPRRTVDAAVRGQRCDCRARLGSRSDQGAASDAEPGDETGSRASADAWRCDWRTTSKRMIEEEVL